MAARPIALLALPTRTGHYAATFPARIQERYDAWLGSLDMLTRVNFKELITAVENWKPEILAIRNPV
jgi:hypothetical protein